MPKWEYKYIYADPAGITVRDQYNNLHDSLSSYLAEVGLEGWEIIKILPEMGVVGEMMIFFKRPKE